MSTAGSRRLLRGLVSGRSRIEALGARLDEVVSQLEGQQESIQRHRQRLDVQRDRLDDHRDRLDEIEGKVVNLGVVYSRLEHQVAALEVRAEGLSADRTEIVAADSEMSEARRLLDEVRGEHAQIRARFQVVTRYEERVRRLEEALKPTPGAG